MRSAGETRLRAGHASKQQPPWTESGARGFFPPARLHLHIAFAALNIRQRCTRSRVPHCEEQIYCLFPWSAALGGLERKIAGVSCNSALRCFPDVSAMCTLYWTACQILKPLMAERDLHLSLFGTGWKSEGFTIDSWKVAELKRAAREKDGWLTTSISTFWSPNLQIKGVNYTRCWRTLLSEFDRTAVLRCSSRGDRKMNSLVLG